MMEFDLARSIDLLSRTPAVAQALLSGLDQDWTMANEGPDTFSPFDVMGHLIDGEETDWLPRARIILDSGPSRPFDPYDRFRHYHRNRGRDLNSLLEEFRSLRASNLEELQSWDLTVVDLDRKGMHPALGEVTLRQLISAWVTHDLAHIGQIARVMAKALREGVGPWRAYMTILDSGPG